MAIEPISGVGASDANSYSDVDVADEYFASRMNAAAWTGDLVDPETKAAALITATSRIDQERYIGVRATTTQRLKWPREQAVDEDGRTIDPASIPRQVIEAVYEQALYMLNLGATDPGQPTGLEPFARLKAGSVDLTMRTDLTELQRSGLAPDAVRLLGLLIVSYDVEQGDTTPGSFKIIRA